MTHWIGKNKKSFSMFLGFACFSHCILHNHSKGGKGILAEQRIKMMKTYQQRRSRLASTSTSLLMMMMMVLQVGAATLFLFLSTTITTKPIAVVHGFTISKSSGLVSHYQQRQRISPIMPTTVILKNKKTNVNSYQQLLVGPLHVTTNIIDPTTIMATTTGASTTTASTMDPLLTYLLQTIITNGVPALFSIIVFGFIAWQFKSVISANRDNNIRNTPYTSLSLLYDDIYGDQDQDPLKRNNRNNPFMNRRQQQLLELPKNVGVPKLQYIQVQHLNPKYDSYQYSMIASTQSKAMAAQQYRTLSYERAWGKLLSSSNDKTDDNTATLTPYHIQETR
jgi:hypothetical protein